METAKSLRVRWIDLTAAILIGACLLALMPLHRMFAAQNDFLHLYAGGLLFGTPEIHSPAVNQSIQRELIGHVLDHSYFIRPAFYGFFLKPLSWMPYHPAYWVFQMVSAVCFAVFLYVFTPQFPRLPILAAMSMPLMANFINGQDSVVLVFILMLAILAMRRKWNLAAGSLLAFGCFRFHLLVMLPLALVAHRKWRVILGGLAGIAVCFCITAAGDALGAEEQLLKMLRNPVNSPEPSRMPNLRALVFDFAGDNTLVIAVASIVVLGLVAYLCVREKDFECAFAYCLVGALLTGFHSYTQDCLLVLFATALLIPKFEISWMRSLLTFAVAPPVYILLQFGKPYSAAAPLTFLGILGAAAYLRASIPARNLGFVPSSAAVETD